MTNEAIERGIDRCKQEIEWYNEEREQHLIYCCLASVLQAMKEPEEQWKKDCKHEFDTYYDGKYNKESRCIYCRIKEPEDMKEYIKKAIATEEIDKGDAVVIDPIRTVYELWKDIQSDYGRDSFMNAMWNAIKQCCEDK